MLRLVASLVAGSGLLTAACAQPTMSPTSTLDGHPAGARLSSAEAIHIATDVAEERGIDLAEFHAPMARFTMTGQWGTWFVTFEGRAPILGNHFAVVIGDDSGEACFDGGR